MAVRRLVAYLLLFLAALPAQSAIAQGGGPPPPLPHACMTQTTAEPRTGEAVTFDSSCSSAPGGTIVSRAWDVDTDGLYDDGTDVTVSTTFATPGTYRVRLRVVDNRGGSDAEFANVTVRSRAPVSAFGFAPSSADTGESITFTSTSSDPDGDAVSLRWDLDGDGAFDDGTDSQVARAYARPGTYNVSLEATDAFGEKSVSTQAVTVGNRPPLAGFSVSPSRPVAGDTVTLFSSAQDPDGSIASQAWDLDNDGAYDDATGARATLTRNAAGSYTVGLRAVDDNGAAGTAATTVTFAARAAAPSQPRPAPVFDVSTPLPPAQLPAAPLRLLDPFPVVRMRGRTTRRGARLTLFSVRAPHGAVARVWCKGRSCPAKRRLTRKIATKSGRGSRTVRLKRLERFLRAGVVLRVTVTQPGLVGKYTRIHIRRLKLPVRVDRCVAPGSAKPTPCPEAR